MGNRTIIYFLAIMIGWMWTLKKPYIGLIVFCAISFLRPERMAYGQLAGIRLALITSFVTLVSWMINQNKSVKNESITFILLVLFYLTTITSSMFAVVDSTVSFKYSFDIFKIVLFCFLLIQIINNLQKLEYFFLSIVGCFIYLCGIGLIDKASGNYRLEKITDAGSNEYAIMLIMFLVVFVYGTKNKNKWYRYLYYSSIPLVLGNIIYTRSRGGFLALVTAVVVFILRSNEKKRYIVYCIVCIPFFVYFTDQAYLDRISTIWTKSGVSSVEITNEEKDGSIESRKEFWAMAIQMANENPFTGVGLENFPLLTSSYSHGIHVRRDTHSSYFRTLASQGYPGLVLFILFIISGFYNTRWTIILLKKNEKTNSYEQSRYMHYALGLESGFAGVTIATATSSMTYSGFIYWMFIMSTVVRNLAREATVEKNINKI